MQLMRKHPSQSGFKQVVRQSAQAQPCFVYDLGLQPLAQSLWNDVSFSKLLNL
jgi:hypothetical protein